MSLRRRVLVGFVAVAAVLVVTNLVLSSTFQSFLVDRVDRQLTDVASRPVFAGERGRGPGPPPGEGQTLTEYFIAVGDRNAMGFSRRSSAFADQDQPPPRLEQGEVLRHAARRGSRPRPFTAGAERGGGSWRLVAVSSPRGDQVTVVGTRLDEVDATLGRIRLVQLAATAAVLVALGVVSWWMLRLGVHPLEDMARTADAIAGGDLSRRVEHPGEKTETGRLGKALNSMLGRIEEAFRAREASEARVRRFAADASHELRTPLTSIQGYTELWRAGGLQSEEKLSEAMRRMEQEARRMAALVEDLLLLARLDQNRPLDRTGVRLDELAADGVRDARAVDRERPIDAWLEPVVVDGDGMQLRQVVANLITNARVHTPTGAAVRVSVAAKEGRARLEVADDGPGMDAATLARVFDRFFRADPSRGRAAGGTGLGLAIVAAVAEAHGGRAFAHSVLGRGSTFVVELPLAARGDQTCPPAPSRT
ncbi:MAG: HAMP domain-containing histidine kinase [Actinomycetota bacterium]|nr:HAMP domain-containing histidine kinase [Actinomycetota bacterium]